MTRPFQPPVIRRDDGSIDIDHYLARSRRLRSARFAASLRALWQLRLRLRLWRRTSHG